MITNNKSMHRKTLIAILGLVVVIFIGTGVYSVSAKKARQAKVATPDYNDTLASLRKERDYARFQADRGDRDSTYRYDVTHDASMDTFYFIENNGLPSGSSIFRYDYVKDVPFQNGEEVNSDFIQEIYREQLAEGYTLSLLDLFDDQIIFYKTSDKETSHSQCYSAWFGRELFSVVAHPNNNSKYSNDNSKHPYVVSPEKEQQEAEKSEQCRIERDAEAAKRSVLYPVNTSVVSTVSLTELRHRIEDWGSYTLMSEKEKKDIPFAVGCPADEERMKSLLHDYPVKKLNLFTSPSRYNIEMYQTPNPFHWVTEQFKELNGCDELGIILAQRAFPDHLLWSFPHCSAGYAPNIDDPDYNDFQRCTEVEKIVGEYLSKE